MADRAAGALRWGRQESNLIRAYLQDGRIDIKSIHQAAYLREIRQREAIWARHPPRNFYQNVRRAAQAFQANQAQAGARRAQNPQGAPDVNAATAGMAQMNMNDNNNNDDVAADDIDDGDDAVDPNIRIGHRELMYHLLLVCFLSNNLSGSNFLHIFLSTNRP